MPSSSVFLGEARTWQKARPPIPADAIFRSDCDDSIVKLNSFFGSCYADPIIVDCGSPRQGFIERRDLIKAASSRFLRTARRRLRGHVSSMSFDNRLANV